MKAPKGTPAERPARRPSRPRPAAAGPEIRNLQRKVVVDTDALKRAALLALAAAGIEGREVSVALVGDRTMARLNRRFTGRRGPTDVLSFNLVEGAYLGEVIVSAETARRQAAERGVPLWKELSLLVVHGILHLAGHDHTLGPGEDRRQRRLEAAVMRKLQRAWAPRAGGKRR